MATVNALIEYYQNLLAYQYANLPNARGTIAALVRQTSMDLIALNIRDGLDIETAVGDQLDLLGEYIGLPRTVNVSLTDRPYWRLIDAEAIVAVDGLTDYADSTVNPTSEFYRYGRQQRPDYEMTDDEYRFMLKFKIAANASDNTLYSMKLILNEFFGTDLEVWDTADFVIGYYAKSTLQTYAQIALASDLLPRPMAVGLSGVFITEDPSKIYSKVDYSTGASLGIGMNDYGSAWYTGGQWLDYADAVTLV